MRGFAVSQSATFRSTSLTTAPAFLIVSSSSLIFAIAFSVRFSQAAIRSGARTAAIVAHFFKMPPSRPLTLTLPGWGRRTLFRVWPRAGAGIRPYDSRGRFSHDPYNFRAGTMPGRVTLLVTAGPIQGKRFEFSEHDTFLFGRSPDCHAQL